MWVMIVISKFKMATITNRLSPYLCSEERYRHDFGGYTHVVRANESNEIDYRIFSLFQSTEN